MYNMFVDNGPGIAGKGSYFGLAPVRPSEMPFEDSTSPTTNGGRGRPPLEMGDADEFRPSELVGSAVQRREDPHLLTGDAEYTDDIQYPGETHLAIYRSQYGHARIESIDTSAVEAVDGVIGVYTATDIQASGVQGTLPTGSPDERTPPEQPILAREKVTYQGQPIAGVVAENRYVAHEAVDRIDVEYERLPAVVDPVEALDEATPTIHDDAPTNVAFEWETGDEAAVDAAFEDAGHIVDVDLEINRVVPTAMEPRAAVARYTGSTGELSMELSTQNPHQVKSDLAFSLSLPDHKIHVRPPDVGGGFGAKLQPYTGYVLAAWCTIQLERPVKWVATRTGDIQSMVHSRHHLIDAEVAVSTDGVIQGLRADTVAPVGGFLVSGGKIVPTNLGVMANGQYAVPAAHVHTTGTYTNTAPLAAYRGAGRPESTYFIERLVRFVADDLNMDPVEFRRKNVISPEQFPYETGLGRTYDSGDYEHTMDVALDMVDYEAFCDRQQEAREEGRYLGIGLSCYVEACGAAPGWHETGVVQITPSGKVVVKSGTAEIGTGHRTSYAQIAASELGIPYDDVEVIEGDTDQVVQGGGTAGSRAMPVGGSAVRESAETVREKARAIAARHLEAAPEDIELTDGKFAVRGAPARSISIEEVAEIAYSATDIPEDMDPGLEATSYYDPPNYTFPFGTHIAIVEVTPDTGEITFERYLAVDDVGNQINPKIVEGQVHGGVVQGIGQALYEEAIYDSNGTLQNGSLQDYAVPKAEHVPPLEWDATITECPHNPLGVKGVGEAGAIAATPAVVNAVVDALAPFGVEHIDMPVTAEKIWRAVRDGE